MPIPARPKPAPQSAAWPPWTSSTWVANRPPTPNIETNDRMSGISDTPPTSRSKTAPRMSSTRTVISSRPPPINAQTTKMKSSTGIVNMDLPALSVPRGCVGRTGYRPAMAPDDRSVGGTEQHGQPALEGFDTVAVRAEADRGGAGGVIGQGWRIGIEREGDLPRLAEAIRARLLFHVPLASDEPAFAIERADQGTSLGIG